MKKLLLLAISLSAACGGSEDPGTIANQTFEAETLCKVYERNYCDARARCGQAIPNCNLECFRYSGQTTVTADEGDLCWDDLQYNSCNFLEDDAFSPSSCTEVVTQLAQHKE